MPHLGPISVKDLIAALQRAGFEGPFNGTRHRSMRRGTLTIRVPNPHAGDISTGLLRRLLKEAGLTRGDWERL